MFLLLLLKLCNFQGVQHVCKKDRERRPLQRKTSEVEKKTRWVLVSNPLSQGELVHVQLGELVQEADIYSFDEIWLCFSPKLLTEAYLEEKFGESLWSH